MISNSSSTAEEELRQCLVQVLALDEPDASERVPFNEDEVDSAQFFIAEKLPAGNYALMQLAALGNIYSSHSLSVGVSDITTEQNVQ